MVIFISPFFAKDLFIRKSHLDFCFLLIFFNKIIIQPIILMFDQLEFVTSNRLRIVL